MNKKKTISLSMIVKNEGRFLDACLRSVQKFVDEIVIVDTGSTDSTISIAEQYGAKIFLFAWNGNFSDARNASLQHCTCDWILYLDADERLEADGISTLQSLLRTPHADAYELSVVSLKHEQTRIQQTSSYQIRLFRRDKRYKFQYRIHEMIKPAILEQNGVIEKTSAVIHHDGYDCSPEEMQKKMERNLPILLLDAEEYPENFFLQKRLAQTQFVLGKLDDAYATVQKTVRRIEQQSHAQSNSLSCGQMYLLYSDILFKQKKYNEAKVAAEQSLQYVPNQNFAHFLLSQIYEAQFLYDEAIAHLNKIIPYGFEHRRSMAEEDVFPLKQDILHQRASLYKKMNNVDAEKKDLAEVVRLAPTFVMGLFDYASVLARTGKMKDALKYLHTAQALEPKNASIYYLRGNIFFKLEQYREAYSDLKNAFEYGTHDDALLLLLIRLARQLQKGAEAVPYCDYYLQRHGAAADILLEAVQLLLQNNNISSARAMIERSLPEIPAGTLRTTINEIYQQLHSVQS